MDIHNFKGQFDRSLERIKESKEISEINKGIIFKFKDYLLSEGIGICKINRYLQDLMKLSRMIKKPLPEASKDDLTSSHTLKGGDSF
ncbi:hypothetical protein J4404_01250 [Candidatus Woesearchaeota archaeon]|nr:hypothetical protein [Candidatus Woesearchaeota archaeon]